MNIQESTFLMNKYGVCPECGNDKVGGKPSQGALIIEDEIFIRKCKCGWSVKVDRRIKHRGTLTKRKGTKLVGGVFEVLIYGQGRKYLPLLELKSKACVKRVDHTTKMENWLNTTEGRKWALEVTEASVH